MIKIKQLDEGFAKVLDPYVRDKFLELLDGVRSAKNMNEERPF